MENAGKGWNIIQKKALKMFSKEKSEKIINLI